MMRIDFYYLWKSGLLDVLIEQGMKDLPITVQYCKIYDVFKTHRDDGYLSAIEQTAEQLSVSEITVRRAVAYIE